MQLPTSDRPVLKVPRTTSDRLAEAVALLGLLVLAGLPLLAWSSLPNRVPFHFDVYGTPDSWASRWTVFLLPLVAAALYAGLTPLARFPHAYNYPWPITATNARDQYRLSRSMVIWLKAEMVLLFAFIEWRILQTARGEADGLGVLFLPTFLGVIFGTIGLFLYRSYKAR